MTATLPDNSLLRQLQQRLISLAGAEATHLPALNALIVALFNAQQSGSGVLTVDAANTLLTTPFSELAQAYPHLIGTADSPAPITQFANFVAFRRIYRQLHSVADEIHQRKTLTPPSENALAKIAWESGFTLSAEQQLAAFTAASLPFCVMTGGAGTGKTTTLAKALELILLDHPDADIFLAAPTGKAAQRLNESLSKQIKYAHASVREPLTKLHAKTLHRLLGVSERSGRAHHHADNPLCCDVLAIDEASMIGSDLLAQTLAALPTNAKLILLGDANQLPPIQSVAFFNDISRLPLAYSAEFAECVQTQLGQTLTPIENASGLSNVICQLTIARRFEQQSTIERCADATLKRDSTQLIHALSEQLHAIPNGEALYQHLQESYPSERQDLLNALANRMILCANRQGKYGSEAINAQLDAVFRQVLAENASATWYKGRQILIEKNDADLQLSNGDIGRCFSQSGQWWLDFGDGRTLPVTQCPPDFSLAFAISIHKSQGSEYTHVDMVLDSFDPLQPNPLINAPLIYTGITRAKQSLTVFADSALLQHALSTDEKSSPSPLWALLGEP